MYPLETDSRCNIYGYFSSSSAIYNFLGTLAPHRKIQTTYPQLAKPIYPIPEVTGQSLRHYENGVGTHLVIPEWDHPGLTPRCWQYGQA